MGNLGVKPRRRSRPIKAGSGRLANNHPGCIAISSRLRQINLSARREIGGERERKASPNGAGGKRQGVYYIKCFNMASFSIAGRPPRPGNQPFLACHGAVLLIISRASWRLSSTIIIGCQCRPSPTLRSPNIPLEKARSRGSLFGK